MTQRVSGVEWNKLEVVMFYTLNYVVAVHEKIVYCTLFEARK